MIMCQDHWNQLRQAIEERGLMHLVSKDGRAAVERTKEQLETQSAESFDPLMSSYFAILGAVIDASGFTYLNDDPPCAICDGDRMAPGLAHNWINGAADDALANARELGLAPQPT